MNYGMAIIFLLINWKSSKLVDNNFLFWYLSNIIQYANDRTIIELESITLKKGFGFSMGMNVLLRRNRYWFDFPWIIEAKIILNRVDKSQLREFMGSIIVLFHVDTKIVIGMTLVLFVQISFFKYIDPCFKLAIWGSKEETIINIHNENHVVAINLWLNESYWQ